MQYCPSFNSISQKAYMNLLVEEKNHKESLNLTGLKVTCYRQIYNLLKKGNKTKTSLMVIAEESELK